MGCKYLLIAGFGAILSIAGSARAAAFNFATFNETSGGRPFTFVNNVTGAMLNYNANFPVLFDFTAPTGLSTIDRPATLTVSAVAIAPATLGGGILDQPVMGALAPDVLTITENSTGKILLRMAFSGDLIGKANDVSALLSGNDALGNAVIFTSDYLTFTAPGNSYDLSLSAITPVLSLGAGGFLNSFAADFGGSFNTNAVPEPAMVSVLGIGSALLLRRKRNAMSL